MSFPLSLSLSIPGFTLNGIDDLGTVRGNLYWAPMERVSRDQVYACVRATLEQ